MRIIKENKRKKMATKIFFFEKKCLWKKTNKQNYQ